MILLKVAAVLGATFPLKLVAYCSASVEAEYSSESLCKLLENRDLIEFLFDSEQDGQVFRFTYSFFSQTLRNLQIFEGQRKQAHEKTIHFMQETQFCNHLTKWSYQIEEMLLLQHILAKDRVSDEADLGIKSKQGLIIKRINNRFLKKENLIKQGLLSKKEHKSAALRSYEERCVVISMQEIAWYQNRQAFKL